MLGERLALSLTRIKEYLRRKFEKRDSGTKVSKLTNTELDMCHVACFCRRAKKDQKEIIKVSHTASAGQNRASEEFWMTSAQNLFEPKNYNLYRGSYAQNNCLLYGHTKLRRKVVNYNPKELETNHLNSPSMQVNWICLKIL